MQRPKLTEILLRKIFLEGAVSEPRRNTLGTENFVRKKWVRFTQIRPKK